MEARKIIHLFPEWETDIRHEGIIEILTLTKDEWKIKIYFLPDNVMLQLMLKYDLVCWSSTGFIDEFDEEKIFARLKR